MSRGADPLAIRTQGWRPYSYVAPPQRAALREQMTKPGFEPMERRRGWSAWLWARTAIMTVCTLYALSLWIVR